MSNNKLTTIKPLNINKQVVKTTYISKQYKLSKYQ